MTSPPPGPGAWCSSSESGTTLGQAGAVIISSLDTSPDIQDPLKADWRRRDVLRRWEI